MAKRPPGGSGAGDGGGGQPPGKPPHGRDGDGGDGSGPGRRKVTPANNVTDAQNSVETTARAGRPGTSRGASSTRSTDTGKPKDPTGPGDTAHGDTDTGGTSGDSHRGGGAGDGADARSRARQDPDSTSDSPGSQGATRDPVDVVSGDVFLTLTDVSLPGTLPLVLDRTHLSSYRLGRAFGRTWASTLDTRLELDADGGALLLAPDGVILVYRQAPRAGVVYPEAGRRLGLSPASGGGFVATTAATGVSWHFTPVAGGGPGAPGPPGGQQVLPLTAITHRCGDRIDFVRADGVVREVVHSGGYRVAVDWADRRVVRYRLAGADGRHQTLVSFGYPDGELLGEVVNSSGLPLRYDYDDAGRLTRWTDRNQRWYGYTYDERGRCVHSAGAGGYLTTRLAYDEANRTTAVTDALGYTTTHTYDEHRKVVRVVDPLGGVTLRTWDRSGNLLAETNPVGATSRYEYDPRGNLVRSVGPDGATTTAVYTEDGLLAAVTGPDGGTWTRTFDARGNLLTLTDPAGAVTTCTWDGSGHLASLTDATGTSTTYSCDGTGLPRTVTDPNGATSRYERDPAGRIVTVTDPTGAKTTTRYTPDGLPAARTDPTGGTETWHWDPEGNLLEHASPTGAVTRFEYTQFDEPVARTDPDGTRLTFGYDARLQVSTVTNPQGLTWTYQYDPVGRLVAETDFDGRTLRYLLDPADRVIGKLNGLGESVYLTRDAAGRVVTRTAPEGQTHYSYDPAGRLLRAVSPTSDLSYTYDPVGRVLTETVDGRTTTNGYDPIGRRTSRTTPTGVVSTWTHAVAGAPTSVTTAGRTIQLSHDAVGNLLEQTLTAPSGSLSLRQGYDPMGRLVAQTLLAVPAAVPADGPVPARLVTHRAYSYRLDGLLTRIVDTDQGPRDLTLDPVGRITAVSAANWTERYAYDEAGNITQAEWPVGAATTSAAAAAPGDREYQGTLVRRVGRVRYEYDAQGRVVLRQVARHSAKPDTWHYQWDSDDRLTMVVCPDGDRWVYQYDPHGRRTGKHRYAPDGRVREQVVFAWDGVRLIEQVHYRHEGAGAGATATTWEYEPGTHIPLTQHQRHWANTASQAEIDERFHAIVTDLLGTPTHLVAPDGTVDWHAIGTIWGSTTYVARTAGADCPLRFPGQYHDPETGHHYNHHRYYDPEAGRYLSQDPLGLSAGPRPTAYVSNPLAWIDPLGLKCPADHTGNPEIRPDRALTETVVDGRRVIYDARGVPHVIGEAPTGMAPPIVQERAAFDQLNNQLRGTGEHYDPTTGNGSEFLWQNDTNAIVPNGTVTLGDGTTAVTGTTADFVRVTRRGGEIVDVQTYDVTSSTRGADADSLASIRQTILNKMDPTAKSQTENVVFVANSRAQADGVRQMFDGDPRVQVIYAGE